MSAEIDALWDEEEKVGRGEILRLPWNAVLRGAALIPADPEGEHYADGVGVYAPGGRRIHQVPIEQRWGGSGIVAVAYRRAHGQARVLARWLNAGGRKAERARREMGR